MADYLLLKFDACPQCRCKGRVVHFNPCPNCNTMLFKRPIDFELYEADGNIRHYWMYDAVKGWMHRDAIMEARFKPNEREYKPEKLPDDYGKQTTPEAIQARGGKLKLQGKVKPAKKYY